MKSKLQFNLLLSHPRLSRLTPSLVATLTDRWLSPMGREGVTEGGAYACRVGKPAPNSTIWDQGECGNFGIFGMQE